MINEMKRLNFCIFKVNGEDHGSRFRVKSYLFVVCILMYLVADKKNKITQMGKLKMTFAVLTVISTGQRISSGMPVAPPN